MHDIQEAGQQLGLVEGEAVEMAAHGECEGWGGLAKWRGVLVRFSCLRWVGGSRGVGQSRRRRLSLLLCLVFLFVGRCLMMSVLPALELEISLFAPCENSGGATFGDTAGFVD